MNIAVAEQSAELTRAKARDIVARVFAANRGKSEMDILLALGTASFPFGAKADRAIWLDEIRMYREEHGL